ncbi:MAG TPA: hypothetical protein VNI60_00915 [Pyrinomonadaceae bacterium]|nr:hypothetical protein [Pyrinomonadaceae bacterium]
MRQIVSSCVFLFTLFFVSPAIIEACSCIGSGPPCQSFWNTEVVFSGQVTEIKDTPAKPASNGDNEFSSMFRTKTVRLAVTESFRGIEERSVELETGLGGGDCGFAFETGQSYLIYAYRNKETGKLGTGICTRTQLLSKATEDLEYFRGLKDAKAGGTVYGKVTKYLIRKSDDEYKPNPPLQNIRLTFLGNGNSYEALTDEKGEYRLSNLAAGEYKMRVKVPEGMWGFEKEQTIKIPDKGCAVTYTALATKTFLSGKIQTDEAAPAAKIAVNLIPVEQIGERYQKDTYFAYTDEQGRYLFKEIPAGTYYLGIRLDRSGDPDLSYPRTFYPGTTDLQNAAPITITEGQVIENFDFALGKKLTTRKIRGVVLMPDGKPVAKARLCIEEVEYSESSSCWNGIETDAKGQFSYTLMNNLRYLIRAHITIQTNQRHAEPVEIAANGDVSDVKLVITEANGSCEKCRVWKRNKN